LPDLLFHPVITTRQIYLPIVEFLGNLIMLLKEIKIGQQSRIVRLLSDDTYCRRLCEMGFLPGTPFVIKHRAPFGYPISIEIRGYEVIIGAHDASIIEVEDVR
jgi:Fe2+ transport system protein FeoA